MQNPTGTSQHLQLFLQNDGELGTLMSGMRALERKAHKAHVDDRFYKNKNSTLEVSWPTYPFRYES